MAERKRRLSAVPLAARSGTGEEARGEPLFMSTNPVRRGAALAAPAVDAEAPAVAVPEAPAGWAPPTALATAGTAGLWYRHSDAVDVWFTNAAGDTVWPEDLPAGAHIAPEGSYPQ